MEFGTPPPPASSFLSQIPRPEIESASPLPWASPKDFKRAFYRPRPPNLHTLCLFVPHLFTVSSLCFAAATHPLCTDPRSPLLSLSLSPPLIILSTSADLTNYKVNGDPTFYVSAKGLSARSVVYPPLVSASGCLLVYSHIKGLADSSNQIILSKQKDLLQLVIDFSYPLCSADSCDCPTNPAKTT